MEFRYGMGLRKARLRYRNGFNLILGQHIFINFLKLWDLENFTWGIQMVCYEGYQKYIQTFIVFWDFDNVP